MGATEGSWVGGPDRVCLPLKVAWALGTCGCQPCPNQPPAGAKSKEGITGRTTIRRPSPCDRHPQASGGKSPSGIGPRQGAWAQSGQWEQLFALGSGGSPSNRACREEWGLGLHRARDLGSLLNGPTVAERRLRALCGCVSARVCVHCLCLCPCVCVYGCVCPSAHLSICQV